MRFNHLLAITIVLSCLGSWPSAFAGEQSGGGGLGRNEFQADLIDTDDIVAIIDIPNCEWRYLEASILDGQARYSKSLKTLVYGLESYQSEQGSWRLNVETESGEVYTLESR